MLFVIAASLLASDLPVDLKGIALGSTIAEFKQNAAPAGTRVVCSDGSPDKSWLKPSKDYNIRGIVSCSFEEEKPYGWIRYWLTLNERISMPIMYSFYEGRLYEIYGSPDAPHAAAIKDGLESKWGKPASVTQEHFQLKSGATFSQNIYTWRVGSHQITLTTPDLNIEKMTILYTDTAVAARLEKQEKALNSNIM